MSVCFAYLTAGSPEEARRIGRTLVEERLAACVNLFDGMSSIYRWQGVIETATETVMIAKTRPELFEALTRRVRELHSYATPCIIELPLARIDADYLAWLTAETAPEPPRDSGSNDLTRADSGSGP
ncbi:MAG: divalent-cation tolerance protein CutA [Rhodospirillaceae bacterium]